MKAVYKSIFLTLVLSIFCLQKVSSNGCTGSWFNVQYSPWCDCYQVCGNYISDCDQLVSVDWNFGDGTTVSGGSPCHHYATPGTYTITMTIVAYCHNILFNLFTTTCHITQTVTVTSIAPAFNANFVADTVCLGNSMQFTNTSVGTGTNSYTWIFGDGTTSSAQNPIHTFDSCGTYNVTLIVDNSTPCCAVQGHDTLVQTVYINCPPNTTPNLPGTTDPYITTSSGLVNVLAGTCLGDTTYFQVNTTGPITSWLFHFPDSTTSTSANPTYVFPACPPVIPYTTVDITTNHGCTGIIDSITGIFCPSNIALTSTVTQCTGQCSGTATATFSGGTPPYSVTWNDPGNQNAATATGLCPGNYNVTVTDGNGCPAVPAQPVAVLDFPFPLAGTTTIQGLVRCYGWNGGSALLSMSGGTPGYTYYWDNGTYGDTVVDLSGGLHNVTATDAHGCTFITSVNIAQPPPITATIAHVDAACGVCNGTATVNAAGGTGAYLYTWLTTPNQTSQTAIGLCAGLYLVIVEDGGISGCRDTFSVAINENGAQPLLPSTSTNATCSNICNGTATANLSGGCLNPPCTYQWLDSLGAVIAGQTNALANNLCPGNYTVHVTNGLGCNSFESAVINSSSAIVPTATPTLNTCGLNCNGTISTSGSGGVAPYTYMWFDSLNNVLVGQTNPTIQNLCPGNYIVQFTDQQGCIARTNAVILNNPLVVNVIATSVLCNGDCNGVVTATTSGGVAPYSYLVQNAGGATVYTGASSIIANLCAGNYTLIASDANSCSLNIPFVISQPAALNPITGTIAPSCFGNCNGSASVNVSGGTPAYVYEWRNSSGAVIGTNNNVSNLCPGNYAVKVTDANNCATTFIPVPLTQPTRVADSMVIVNPYCNNGLGSIDLTPYGGTPPYTYSWNNGLYTTQDISGLAAGTFTVLIADFNGCTKRDTSVFTIYQNIATNIVATLYNGFHVKCFGGADGEVVLDVTGGLPPYTYLWNDPANSTVDSIWGLDPGITYTVTVTDANGCIRLDSIPLNLIPPPFSITTSSQNVLCAGDNNGSVAVVPVGGIPPYVYFWNGDTSVLNTPLTNLPPGQYIAYVFDANFCLKIDTEIITAPAPIVLSHTSTNATCFGSSDGSIDETVGGGIVPYVFSWNSGAYLTEDLNAIPAGQYALNMVDSNGCVRTDTVTITEPTALVLTLATTNVSCFGLTDGAIDLTVSGGTLNYSYLWSNTSTNQDLTGLGAGNNSVVLTDGANCTASASATITAPAQPLAATLVAVDVTCNGAANGSVNLTPTGGTTTYTFVWNNLLTTEDIFNLSGGNYSVTVTDTNNCSVSVSATVFEPVGVITSTIVSNVSCNGGNDGAVDLTVNGGINPLSYLWSNTLTTQDINGVAAATYYVAITDSNGCVKNDSAVITQPNALAITLVTNNISCFGGSNGSIDLTVSGGTPNYNYNWNSGAFITEDLQNLNTGSYSVVVTDNKGCTATNATSITEPNILTGNRQITICDKDSFLTGGTYQSTPGIYVDTLTTSIGCDSILSTDLNVVNNFSSQIQQTLCYGQQFLLNGNYYSATGVYVDTLLSSGGCDSVVTLSLNILSDIGLYADPNKATLTTDDSITVFIYSSTGANLVSYNWSPTIGISCSTCSSAVVAPPVDVRYSVVAVDANGCRDTVLIPIIVQGPVIFVPNVFTPNGDNNNDFFQIFGNLKPLRFLEIQVFNRWGEKVFESNDHHFKWDGTYKGVLQNPGVYVWTLKLGFLGSANEELRKGSITLMR